MNIDGRLNCIESNGRGSLARYTIAGAQNVQVVYDREQHPYPWSIARVCNGRLMSGETMSYSSSKSVADAVNNLENAIGIIETKLTTLLPDLKDEIVTAVCSGNISVRWIDQKPYDDALPAAIIGRDWYYGEYDSRRKKIIVYIVEM